MEEECRYSEPGRRRQLDDTGTDRQAQQDRLELRDSDLANYGQSGCKLPNAIVLHAMLLCKTFPVLVYTNNQPRSAAEKTRSNMCLRYFLLSMRCLYRSAMQSCQFNFRSHAA